MFPKPKSTKQQKREHKKRKLDPSTFKKDVDIVMEDKHPEPKPMKKSDTSQPTDISELRARLHAKIEQLRQNRQNSSKPQSRTDLLDSRNKRKEEKDKRKKQIAVQQDSISKKRNAECLNDETPTAVNSDNEPNVVKENISFGNIQFGVEENAKKKGPMDTLGKLKKVTLVPCFHF